MEATKTQPAAGGGRPPRPKAHKPSRGAWSPTYSPYAGPVRASPRAVKLAHPEPALHRDQATARPKRPLSASRVASTTSSRLAQTSPRPNSARPARPSSASQARYTQLETIAFPMQRPMPSSTSDTCEACLSPPPSDSELGAAQEEDATAMHMKLQALLEMWGEERLGFRSPALFCETAFRQAKALASRMPRPNAFVSAVAFACLTQMGAALDEQYPFLGNIIQELGTVVYSNFTDLQHHVELEEQPQIHRSALFFEHGKPWFQEMMLQKMRCKSFQTSADASTSEVQLLQEMLQEARSANSTAMATAAAAAAAAAAATLRAPSRRDKLDDYYIPPVLRLGDLSLESLSDEVLQAFSNVSDADARHLLTLLMENAVEREIAKLPDMLAETVGQMKGQDRRKFLRECFDYVTASELQDALHERDELNDDKRYQALVDDLHELLPLQPQEAGVDTKHNPSATVALFHSEEARIGKRVHELVELVEDVATEVALFKLKHKALFPEPLLERLRRYECPVKRLQKAHELMQRQHAQDTDEAENPQCKCVCGRLIDADEGRKEEAIAEAPLGNEDEDAKKQTPRRKSTLKRPLSAPSGRRKNAISFNTRFGSPRKSSAFIHVFPLAEVCHLLSAILHLQFSRDAAEPLSARGGEAVSALLFDDRFEFLKQDASSRTFKTLAKDYLMRKYGIKSIAVMHTMQLERSLLHYTDRDKHVRCELFSWFFGADKSRAQSKDYAFAFFQKLVKCILTLCSVKKTPRSSSITSISSPKPPQPQPLAYSALITTWTEYIGDGEPTNPRSILVTLALETCKQVFPPAMQRNSHLTIFRDKLYRHSLEQKTIELEEFLHGAMAAWQFVFDAQMQEASKSIDTAGILDAEGFTRCLAANGLEFTTGERYELFDLLTQEGDENVIPSKKMAQLIMEAKYLRPAVPSSTFLGAN
ncbi:hypothetical protein PHYPSEUDO_013056 [Phytophthora pseudosyringae]|uniref:Uncharacterized protein n=1 Tax=Phytophthora pseudosyringae TaxID=221518 RepID=A0A8T1W4C4_9STRA|nr:hypothetical protein PHYPSEUDO_013056 [Phytophthora pseudosyringae]